ncbi:MAG TPA: HEAT repeat domain-containing protein [Methylomirabilota bacterium]|nr:HEAT repeat domain-containing protein [Methylomirabilota bacterium]
MPVEQSLALAEFARACKAAARAVSLYPGAHPAIGGSLGRLVSAIRRLSAAGETVLVVHPATLMIDDRAPVRPDASIGELAELLHGRLIGTLRVHPDASADDWRALLLLLARPLEELIAEGGIHQMWTATGRGHFEIQEIDYAEVLRERRGSSGADWDRLLANCLKGEAVELDDAVINSLMEAVESSEKFGELLDRLNDRAETDGSAVSARIGALMHLLRATLAAVEQRNPAGTDEALTTVARATPHLSPDMLIGLLTNRMAAKAEDAAIAKGVVDRIDDGTIASIVARSVASERGATDRLAQVFEALAPDAAKKGPLLDMARAEAEQTEFGSDPRFPEVWQSAVTILNYSDKSYVSSEYARELSSAKSQAVEVERLSEDPPERIAAWLASVNEAALRDLDLLLTLDLMRVEDDPDNWGGVADLAVREIELRAHLGDIAGAQRLAAPVAEKAAGPEGKLRTAATASLDTLARSALVKYLIGHIRKANDTELTALTALCQTIGPRLVLPFAEALSTEDHTHTIRRIRELLISFGAEGRRAVEPLKNSTKPAVRRTAVDLLRIFGGNEALVELTPLLDDADPQVQRDAVRAIAQIGTPEAYAVVDRACAANDAARELIVREMIVLRDSRAVPSLAAVLKNTSPRGALAVLHESIIDALAGLGAHADSTSALRGALDRGDWWAPRRTAALRKAAATALKRIGSAETLEALEDALRSSSRGVRAAARLALGREGAVR